ncbi:MAG: glutamine amidotransferase [Candidatus Binataceae bacterium]
MKSVTAIRFVHFEDLGSFATVLDRQGYAIKYVDAASDEVKSVEPLGPDLLICLGGPIGAYEDDAYPALRSVLNIIERRLTVNRPTLGICLGSQLIARALGARVYPGGRKEIGWSPLRLTTDGRGSVLRRLDPGLTSVLHWHGDTFDLPEGATLLASSELYGHQAFAVGHNVLALQFHPEVTVAGLERWYIGHACEIAATSDVEVTGLRADSARYAPALESAAAMLLTDWLDQLERREGAGHDGHGTRRSLSGQ